MSNPYIQNYYNTSEQSLVEDLTAESIQIAGVDMLYVPRTFVKQDLLFGEDILSKFTKTYAVEVYVETHDGFGGGDLISKFGATLEIQDTATFLISKKSFDVAVEGAYIRPNEGDLIYFPFNQALYEIKFVEHQKPFYQLGNLTLFELHVELFQYSHEKIETGTVDVDLTEKDFMYSLYATMGAGTGTYQNDETVYQGASLAAATATGEVEDYAATVLRIKNITGKFLENTLIKGNTSGASRLATTVLDTTFAGNEMADNKRIEDKVADGILDFSEDNPFAEE